MGNLARDEFRGQRRRLRLLSKVPTPVAAPDHADGVAERLDDQARAKLAAQALATLPPAQRRAASTVYTAPLRNAKSAGCCGGGSAAETDGTTNSNSRIQRAIIVRS